MGDDKVLRATIYLHRAAYFVCRKVDVSPWQIVLTENRRTAQDSLRRAR